MLSFEDAPVGEVVAAANRYSKNKVIIVEASARALRFTGTFRSGEPRRLAGTLGQMFGLEATRNPQGAIIVRRMK